MLVGGSVSSPTPRPVPVRRTEGFRHIAVEGGESPNQCGIETPGLRTLGLPGSAALPTSQQHKHALRIYTRFQSSCNHASSGRPGPTGLTYKSKPRVGLKHVDLQLAIKPRVAAHTPPRDPGQPDLQLAKKPQVAAHTAKPNTFGPTTCKAR